MTEIDIHHAARKGDLDAVKAFLEQGGDVRILDRYDCEPLYYAVKHNQLEIARLLLKAGGQVNRSSRFRGDPIGAAVWNFNLRMIKFVVKAGADVNRISNNKRSLDDIDELKRLLEFQGKSTAKLEKVEKLLISLGAKRANDET
ncbi:MAG TPA: ankyrin repeat domain-containing protein [Segetibacter sp.]